MFIKPAELTGLLARHGLKTGEVTGLGPRASLPAIVRGFIAARRGRITYGEFSRRLDIGQVASTAVSYMGFAVKDGDQPGAGTLAGHETGGGGEDLEGG